MSTVEGEARTSTRTERKMERTVSEFVRAHTFYIFKNRGSFLEYKGEIISSSNGEAAESYRRRTGEDMGGVYTVRKGTRLTPLEARSLLFTAVHI